MRKSLLAALLTATIAAIGCDTPEKALFDMQLDTYEIVELDNGSLLLKIYARYNTFGQTRTDGLESLTSYSNVLDVIELGEERVIPGWSSYALYQEYLAIVEVQ